MVKIAKVFDKKFLLAFIVACLFCLLLQWPSQTFADETLAAKLSDEIVLEKISALEVAFAKKQTDFFRDNLHSDSKVTIHAVQRDNKDSVAFSKKQILDGELFRYPNDLPHLKKDELNISYYNENTQALVTYKLLPKDENNLLRGQEILFDIQVLFQIMDGSVKILKIIMHVDNEPSYTAKQKQEQQ